jgi:hypothetical protein
VTDREIDELLQRAAKSTLEAEPVLLARVAGSIKSSMQPVRPLPAAWMLTVGLVLICAVVAIVGAARAGFYGIEKLGLWDRMLIFSTLTILIWMAATKLVREMIPGSLRLMSPRAQLLMNTVALLVLFSLLFRDYHTEHFLSAGIACLLTGVLHAIPAALLGWLLVRRGFAINSVAAGLTAGTLGGLAGVTMLELHCANFQALHVLLWHTAVVPASGALGALVAWAIDFGTNLGPQ